MTSSSDKAQVVWFCGLSGSGKTTIAVLLNDHLEQQGKRVLVLDGDVVRESYKVKLGFTRPDILQNNENISKICLKKAPEYDYIIVPVISPFKEGRERARNSIGENFIEVFISTPLEICIQRDVKGLYKKALANEIPNFIGISKGSPFEQPHQPEITVDTVKKSPQGAAQVIIDYLEQLSGKL